MDIYVYTHTDIYTRAHMYTHMCTRVHGHTHAHTYVCTHVHIDTHMHTAYFNSGTPAQSYKPTLIRRGKKPI
jgi:hypothetical protein